MSGDLTFSVTSDKMAPMIWMNYWFVSNLC